MDYLINNDWDEHIAPLFRLEEFKKIEKFLVKEKSILPPKHLIFNAFRQCPFLGLKIVVIGQDPYHGLEQANGLAFSVNNLASIPPSLRNIFKEIKSDYPNFNALNGDLTYLANQGVLLLNSLLTVSQGLPGSHQKAGWQWFTTYIIALISALKTNVVFMLWGKYAQTFIQFIDKEKHLVLTAAHPSPLSYHRGFKGCSHFKKANAYLVEHSIKPVEW